MKQMTVARVLIGLALGLWLAAFASVLGRSALGQPSGAAALTATAQAVAALNAPTVTPLPTRFILPTLTPTSPVPVSGGQGTATGTSAPAASPITSNTPVPPTGTLSPPTSTPVPPTNTPAPTATPVPPSPTSVSQVGGALIVPVDAVQGSKDLRGSQAVNGGHYVLLPGLASSSAGSPVVFRDQIVLRVEAFDPAAGQHDGDGIKGVKFTIYSGKKVIDERTETVPQYCAFGGDTECYVWKFSEHDGRWPSGAKVNGGPYTVQILIVSDSGKSAVWSWNFRVQRGD